MASMLDGEWPVGCSIFCGCNLQIDFFFGKGRDFTLRDLAYFGVVYVLPLLLALLMSKPPAAKLELEYETIQFAHFMVQAMASGSLFTHGLDDNNLQSEYPFMQTYSGTWVRIKDLLQFDRLPRQDQDIFLSYSFCRLLARRYFKFDCAEEGDAGVRNLALTQLLSDYKRAFTLVEVQLAFLHDHFFTDHHTKIPNTGLQAFIVLGIGCGVGVSVNLLLGYLKYGHDYLRGGVLPMLGSVLVVALLEALPQFYPILLPNYWHPVRQIFKYYPSSKGCARVDSPSRWNSLRYCQCSKGLGHKYYWRNKIGQYSLLEDYDYHVLNKEACIDWFKQYLLSQESSSFVKHHPTAKGDVSVPDSVRSLVALTLRQHINGRPTKGTESLRRNRHLVPAGYDLLWTCEPESHTQIIMLWHIATCYCDMLAEVEETRDDNYEVATALSKYCTYLVAFLPEFLPEHRLTSMIVLQNVIQSAKEKLKPLRQLSMEEKCSELSKLLENCGANLIGTAGNTFLKGIYLGGQLTQVDDAAARWKVMAEFWVETIIYIAPSDDAAAHIEHLAKGGEFVTHLWAMLSNAGILQRAAEERNLPPPPPPPLLQLQRRTEDRRLCHSQSLPAQFELEWIRHSLN